MDTDFYFFSFMCRFDTTFCHIITYLPPFYAKLSCSTIQPSLIIGVVNRLVRVTASLFLNFELGCPNSCAYWYDPSQASTKSVGHIFKYRSLFRKTQHLKGIKWTFFHLDAVIAILQFTDSKVVRKMWFTMTFWGWLWKWLKVATGKMLFSCCFYE